MRDSGQQIWHHAARDHMARHIAIPHESLESFFELGEE